MQDIEVRTFDAASINYDETPIAELSLDGISYRVDVGHGSAVAVSQRAEGAWTWAPLAEGRWDGTRLKSKGLSYDLVTALGAALKEAMTHSTDGM